MDKIVLTSDDLNYILKWRDEHNDLVRQFPCPLCRVKILSIDTGYTITAIRNGWSAKLCINEKGRSIGYVVFDLGTIGVCRMLKNTTKLNNSDIQSVLTVYCSTMAFMVYGNTPVQTPMPTPIKHKPTGAVPKKRPTKKKTAGITYILNRQNNAPRLSAQGSRSRCSPSGVFTVRGHYRHLKNGKVVWVAQYTKGTGKKKDKRYLLGKKPEE